MQSMLTVAGRGNATEKKSIEEVFFRSFLERLIEPWGEKRRLDLFIHVLQFQIERCRPRCVIEVLYEDHMRGKSYLEVVQQSLSFEQKEKQRDRKQQRRRKENQARKKRRRGSRREPSFLCGTRLLPANTYRYVCSPMYVYLYVKISMYVCMYVYVCLYV